MTELTHKEAVQRMTKWLRNHEKCSVVMAELATKNTETPDVIGFHGHGGSILIECKISRADFLADSEKIFRRDESLGVGDRRYFAMPEAKSCSITAGKMDLPHGWGLLSIGEYQVRTIVEPAYKPANKTAEVIMLMSAIRRLELSTAVFVQTESI